MLRRAFAARSAWKVGERWVWRSLALQSGKKPGENGTESWKRPVSGEDEEGRRRRERPFGTIPNTMTMARMASTPVICWMLVDDQFVPALGLFCFAGFLDFADGWVARNMRNQSSLLGAVLDPVADKVLVAGCFLTMGYLGMIPAWLTGLVVARDVGLVAGGMVLRARTKSPQDGFFDATSGSAPKVTPSTISKLNTALQLSLVSLTLVHAAFPSILPALLPQTLSLLHYTTASTTLGSWIHYTIFPNQVWQDSKKSKTEESNKSTEDRE